MTTKAIIYVEKGRAAIQEVPIPKLRDDYILVRVNSVALNPTDWKGVDLGMGEVGSRIGCDYAGVVEEVGPKVTKPFRKGDRITGMVHGWYSHLFRFTRWMLIHLLSDRTQIENGAFANYIVVKGDVQIKIPDNVSDEDAATLGVSISTVVGAPVF
jgi:NADPH:quinone reductase-like Zn-dependent oxidoreductase